MYVVHLIYCTHLTILATVYCTDLTILATVYCTDLTILATVSAVHLATLTWFTLMTQSSGFNPANSAAEPTIIQIYNIQVPLLPINPLNLTARVSTLDVRFLLL